MVTRHKSENSNDNLAYWEVTYYTMTRDGILNSNRKYLDRKKHQKTPTMNGWMND